MNTLTTLIAELETQTGIHIIVEAEKETIRIFEKNEESKNFHYELYLEGLPPRGYLGATVEQAENALKRILKNYHENG